MISEDVKAQMREICSRYPLAQSGMLPCLHLVQDIEGYVTPDGMAAVSEVTGAKLDEVESVVTFYSMYRRHPLGKHVIKVCTSISCYLCGSDQLIDQLEHYTRLKRMEHFVPYLAGYLLPLPVIPRKKHTFLPRHFVNAAPPAWAEYKE